VWNRSIFQFEQPKAVYSLVIRYNTYKQYGEIQILLVVNVADNSLCGQKCFSSAYALQENFGRHVWYSLSMEPLMMEAVSITETLVNFYQTARCNIPEVRHIHTRRRVNLKSHNAHLWLSYRMEGNKYHTRDNGIQLRAILGGSTPRFIDLTRHVCLSVCPSVIFYEPKMTRSLLTYTRILIYSGR
jgi:hypothetical protein